MIASAPLRDHDPFAQTARCVTQGSAIALETADYLQSVHVTFQEFHAFIAEGEHDFPLERLPTGWPLYQDVDFPPTGLRVLMHNEANLQSLQLRRNLLDFRGNAGEIMQSAGKLRPIDLDPSVQHVFEQFGQSVLLFHQQAVARQLPAAVLERFTDFATTLHELTTRFAAGQPALATLPELFKAVPETLPSRKLSAGQPAWL